MRNPSSMFHDLEEKKNLTKKIMGYPGNDGKTSSLFFKWQFFCDVTTFPVKLGHKTMGGSAMKGWLLLQSIRIDVTASMARVRECSHLPNRYNNSRRPQPIYNCQRVLFIFSCILEKWYTQWLYLKRGFHRAWPPVVTSSWLRGLVLLDYSEKITC